MGKKEGVEELLQLKIERGKTRFRRGLKKAKERNEVHPEKVRYDRIFQSFTIFIIGFSFLYFTTNEQIQSSIHYDPIVWKWCDIYAQLPAVVLKHLPGLKDLYLKKDI